MPYAQPIGRTQPAEPAPTTIKSQVDMAQLTAPFPNLFGLSAQCYNIFDIRRPFWPTLKMIHHARFRIGEMGRLVTNGKEPGSEDSTGLLFDAPIRGLLLTSAKSRLAMAAAVSLALWVGFFWATGFFGAS